MRASILLFLCLNLGVGCGDQPLEGDPANPDPLENAAGGEATAQTGEGGTGATGTSGNTDGVLDDPPVDSTVESTDESTVEPTDKPPVETTDEPVDPPALETLFGCTPGGTTWDPAERLEDGPHFVGTRDFIVVDPDRVTMANGLFPELPNRTITVSVWYPAKKGLLGDLTLSLGAELDRQAGPFPLVVHAHGFMSERKEIVYAAEHLASHGYVVVGLDFPLSKMSALGGATIADVPNQPGDVSFVIDNLLGWSQSSDHPLYQAVDDQKIVMTGTSLGGLTTYLSTYHPDLRDERIRGAATLAAPSFMFTDLFWGHADVPLLLVHGDLDAIIAYEPNALYTLGQAGAKAGVINVMGGTHTGFASAAALLGFTDNPDNIGCQAIAGKIADDPDQLLIFVDPELGIVDVDPPAMCTLDPLPPSMVATRQHELTRLALRAFADWMLAEDDATRQAACSFLSTDLPAAYPDEIEALPTAP